MKKPVILTGIRANNDLHIGNYFGAMLPTIDMAKTRSDEFDVNLFIPDLHSFTTPIDHSQLNNQIMHNARLFAAAGLPLDNPGIRIYRQSYVSAHSELTWILDCFTHMGEMSRMTQYKDKAGVLEIPSDTHKAAQQIIEQFDRDGTLIPEAMKSLVDYLKLREEYRIRNFNNKMSVSVGLYNYPVLMAADILLYGAQYVPVGDDQTQHLEFTRDIAVRMNNQFGELFTVPKAVKEQHEFFGKDQGLRIKDLIDPTKKMSKSDESGRGIVFLGDNPDEAAKKIMSATTDSFGEIQFDFAERPGISNLLQILSLFTSKSLQDVISEWQGKTSYGEFKTAVADSVRAFLGDFQGRLAQVNDNLLRSKLESDERAMNEVANATLHRVQQAVGLRAKG